jgi:hypothetical protein
MARIKKAQKGVKATADSTAYYNKLSKKYFDEANSVRNAPYAVRAPKEQVEKRWKKEKTLMGKGFEAQDNSLRQIRKGKPGYDKNGFPIKKQRSGGSTPAWQRKEGKNPSGGLNAKGVASYRRANPGSKLKTAVTTKPSKLKAGSKAANRRKSFCARMSGMKKRLTSAKTANDPNSRINKSLRKWNC